MIARRTLDVSHLPAHAFGLRSTLVWGALLAMSIEATMMALLVVSFVYYRGNYQVWPPTAVGPAAFNLAAVQMAVLLISLYPTRRMDRAAVREKFVTTRRWLSLVTLLSLVVTALRWVELPRIAFRWDQHAYGSAFWITVGVHVTHILSGAIEFLMVLGLMYFGRQRFEKKHYMDIQVAGLFWYFAVIEWVIVYPVLYLMPLVNGR
jgi:cytochrome c oxidase subunit 3